MGQGNTKHEEALQQLQTQLEEQQRAKEEQDCDPEDGKQTQYVV